MGFGTIFTVITFMMIFAGMTALVINTQKSLALTTTEVTEQQNMKAGYQQQEITITASSYSTGIETSWTVTLEDEFDKGSYANTTTNGDQVELADTNNTGTYTSTEYDTGGSSNYTTISWSSVEPAGGNLTYQLRTGDTIALLEGSPFVGPDGTANTKYDISGSAINDSHNQSRYIQYRAYLERGAGTPELRDTTIGIYRSGGHVKLTVENTGKDKLDHQATDVYIDGVRINRSEADRLLELEIISDPQLWNPGEELNITIFTDITGSALITVTNEYAKDQEVVP